jgi:hypothetical protein
LIEPIFGHDQAVAEWAGQNLGAAVCPPFVAIGFAKEGRLAGACIFNGWNGANIDITIYGPGCLARSSIRTAYRYCFNQIGAQRITARTRRSNRVMRELLPRLGFTQEFVMIKYYGPMRADDAFVYRLTRFNAQRWM